MNGERVVPANWLSNSNVLSGRTAELLTRAFNTVAQPDNARRLRQVLLALLVLWALLALAQLVWSLVPAAAPANSEPAEILNPLSGGSARAGIEPVDIEHMLAWHLFGKAGANATEVVQPSVEAKDNSREGIEQGARQTRLSLKLRGIVASTDDGLGHAIIENKNKQSVYSVEDKLPVPGKVILAKVMPRQVVLDNGGTYELLVLFEESNLKTAGPSTPAPAARPRESGQIDKRADAETTGLAQSYRDKLYKDPQSLVEVVSVSPVREGGSLQGYRVNPGKDQEQFAQLGFQAGDVVTAVNGISLDNPANAMVLYNTMRTAGEAVFELKRDNQQHTLSVNLDSGATE